MIYDIVEQSDEGRVSPTPGFRVHTESSAEINGPPVHPLSPSLRPLFPFFQICVLWLFANRLAAIIVLFRLNLNALYVSGYNGL
jgi:hypothetical protein